MARRGSRTYRRIVYYTNGIRRAWGWFSGKSGILFFNDELGIRKYVWHHVVYGCNPWTMEKMIWKEGDGVRPAHIRNYLSAHETEWVKEAASKGHRPSLDLLNQWQNLNVAG